MTEKELAQLQKKALEQLQSGESLFGQEGAVAPRLRRFIEPALQAEMDGHLDETQRGSGNKRNGKGRKTIKSAAGSFEIDTPQDRHSSFEPELIKKRQTVLADSLQDKIIGLYGLRSEERRVGKECRTGWRAQRGKKRC